MAESAEQDKTEISRLLFSAAIETQDSQQIAQLLSAMHSAEIADLLESLPHHQRDAIGQVIPKDIEARVLLELGDEARDHFISDKSAAEMATLIASLEDVDDQADLLLPLPNALIVQVLHIFDVKKRQKLEAVLAYPEDTAGGLMNTDTITVRADVTLDVVLRYLRMLGTMPRHMDRLFVVDRHDRYLGVLSIRTLLTRATDNTVIDHMRTDVEAIPVDTHESEVARLFEDKDLISAPVVENNNTLLGRITVDDIVDVIRDESEHSMMSMAGLSEEEDIFAPVFPSAKRRSVWLGINLMTALLASWTIGLFQHALDKIVALAILMPIVASMGGIAGSQTLTLVIRGLALGQVGRTNQRWLLGKEAAVALLNGLLWSITVAILAMLWFNDPEIGLILGIALVINLVFGALAGVTIPITLRRFGIDPALAGTVVLTTVTDIIGFIAFLGLATWWLL
ncbi:MAG: magnesium transporter [Gammaproteobacteria bacterium]|nr:magnesium transporter [Gammaproteobacteria bacterium]